MRIDLYRSVTTIALGLWRPEHATADTSLREGVEIMKTNTELFLLLAIAFSCCLAGAEETGNTPPSRDMTLQEAVQLALKHNHDIRIAGYTVEEKQHAKEIAKSSYFPSIRNDSSFLHLTDTQLIAINAGSLGVAGGTPIPSVNSVINQGGRNLTTSGTQITQPLTTLLKIKRENDVAQAEVRALA
jgi:outer membrane protein TolC